MELISENKVIGLGLGRTCTISLCHALGMLGISTIHFPSQFTNEELLYGHAFISALENHQGIANGTGLPYKILDQRYPASRFILTIREKEGWLKSKERYAKWEDENWHAFDVNTRNSKRLLREGVYGSFRYDSKIWYAAYEKHIESVSEYFVDRREDLLIIDIPSGDGWCKLCGFLRLPVPPDPFPHVNSWKAIVEWNTSTNAIRRIVRKELPANQEFILIDDGQLGPVSSFAKPFIERDGIFWGSPQSDDIAILELERMRQKGSKYLVFTCGSFWWLDHYDEFLTYINSNYLRIIESEHALIYDIRSSMK